MRLRDNEIRGLPAFTESGTRLGSVSGFVINNQTHEITSYAISRSGLLGALLPGEFLVATRQVVSLDNEKMIVKDAAVPKSAAAHLAAVRSAAQAGVAASRSLQN